jgi:HK97 family phage portal protein
MSFLVPASRSLSSKSATMSDMLREIFGGRMTAAGKAVNLTTAIQVATIFSGCRVIGNGMAQVPLKLMRESKDGTRLPAKEHRLYKLMSAKPNDWQTSFEFRQMISWHVELCGNAFVFKNRNSTGEILELIPIPTGRTTVRQLEDWTLVYEVRSATGAMKVFPAESIWHIRGPSMDGFLGLDVVAVAREAIGLAMATEESAAQLHKNGVRPAGVYSVEGTLAPDQYKALKEWIDKEIGGIENAGKAMVLDRGAKWINTAMSGIDAQSLETRKHQIEVLCSFLGVMPIMTGFSDKASTYASAEEMFRAHKENCLAPRWEAYEQSMCANLLTEKERDEGLYFDFVEEGMIRGSVKDTKDAILGYVNGGILTPNEGRALLDKNADQDPASNKLRIPANIVGDPKKLPTDAAST